MQAKLPLESLVDATESVIDTPNQCNTTTALGLRVERSAVWFTGQQSRIEQRDHTRYVQESFSHPGKMLPHVIQSIIHTYGEPGDVWLDPMCGIGTTLVEAATKGYAVYGVEWEKRWVEVCQHNINLVRERGFSGKAAVLQGDSRRLSTILRDVEVDKIAFSPPYGNTLSKTSHGPDKYPERQQGGKRAAKALRHGYTFQGTEEVAEPDKPGDMRIDASLDTINLGDLKHGKLEDAIAVVQNLALGIPHDPKVIKPSYLTEMAKVYSECFSVLRPGGLMILVLRDYRREKKRVDLLGDTLDVCEAVGFSYHDRAVAMQCPVQVERESATCTPEGHLGFWTIQNCKDADPPVMIPVFEDILVLRKDGPSKIRRVSR